MAELVTEVGAAGGGTPSGSADGIVRGQQTVAPGQTLEVAGAMFGTDRLLFGFVGTGDGDGFFQLKVGSDVKLDGYVNVVNRTCTVMLPVAQTVTAGTAISLVVRSDAGVSVDFYGTIVAF